MPNILIVQHLPAAVRNLPRVRYKLLLLRLLMPERWHQVTQLGTSVGLQSVGFADAILMTEALLCLPSTCMLLARKHTGTCALHLAVLSGS